MTAHTDIKSPMLAAALDYAARGWHVFPAPPGEKKSHLKGANANGARWGATTDPTLIVSYWDQFPRANVGIAAGPSSGFFVVECDTPAGHDVDGIGNMAALIEQHGPLPDTIEALSPSGSWHIFFRWPEGEEIINGAGEVAPGIDVRGEGGMVIGVPSVKPGRPQPYRWKNPPGLFELGECPEWLLALCRKKKLSEQARANGPKIDTGGHGWSDAALRGEIAAVLSSPAGSRNAQLNTSAFNLGQIIAGGALDEASVRSRLCGAAIAAGLDEAEIGPTIASGLRAGMQAPRGPKERQDFDGARVAEAKQAAAPAFKPTPYQWRDPGSIPPRQWLYGKHLIRSFLSLTVAPGALGKSSMLTVEILSMITGKALLGESMPHPLRVWAWNGEDPKDELDRRFQAACMHYQIGPEAFADRFMQDSGRELPITLATSANGGFQIARPQVEALTQALIDNKVDVLIIDPFVASHAITENDNTAMNAVAMEWRKIADMANCAIELVHHVTKASAIDGDGAGIYGTRGAGALIDAVRDARFLVRMTKEEGERFGVDNHERHFRAQSGKPNLAPAEKAVWRKMVGVSLGNGSGFWPEGDFVGVCTAWTPPDAFEGMTVRDLQSVQRAIDACDQPPKHKETATDWVGYVIAEVLGMNLGRGLKKAERDAAHNAARGKVRQLLAEWIKSGALAVETIHSPRDGRDVPVVVVGDPVVEADIKGQSA